MNIEFVKSKIIRLCNKPRSFEFLSKNLDGLDPIYMHEILQQLNNERKIQFKDDLWSLRELKPLMLNLENSDTQLYLKKYMGYFDFLKLPHPLDFEWRNSTSSLNYLINLVGELNSIKDTILFLGMPTLFAMACIKDIPQKVTLVEWNKPIVKGLSKLNNYKERFNIIEKNIFKTRPEEVGKFDSIIMDPPWYNPHFEQFMWLASQCLKVNGIIGISLPPINTRPEIAKERINWFTFCHEQGLCLENLYTQKLQYSMPFFEFNAFRAAGQKNVPPFWRKGDLALFRKIQDNITLRPLLDENPDKWNEIEIDTIRIRIKENTDLVLESELKIENIIKGDILPTVSSRDERRKEANIWTSGNRIFKTNNPNKFLKLYKEIKVDKKKNTKDKKLISDFLNLITSLEKKEYNAYLKWLYQEMERYPD